MSSKLSRLYDSELPRSTGGLGLPDRDYYLRTDDKFEQYRRAYLIFLTTLLQQGGASTAAREADVILKLETEIAAKQWTRVESRDRLKMYHPLESSSLASEMPGLDWEAWLTELGITIPTRVVVNHSTYIKGLSAFMGSKPIDEWKLYLRAALLDRYARHLHAELVNAEFEYRGRVLAGIDAIPPRWSRGVDFCSTSAWGTP